MQHAARTLITVLAQAIDPSLFLDDPAQAQLGRGSSVTGSARKRSGHAAQHFSVLNGIALDLPKQDKTSQRGIHGKRLKAGWDNDYRLHLLRNKHAFALPWEIFCLTAGWGK